MIKDDFMKKVLIGMFAFLFVFVGVMIWIFIEYGSVPDVLIGAVFAACAGEYSICGLIKNHKDLVIGFCAGAINLSKYSIITKDEDFDESDSYYGIGRENICIEPHYNDSNNIARNKELKEFSKKYNTRIYCIPDESIIYYENSEKKEKGKIYTI